MKDNSYESEWIERAALADLHAAATNDIVDELGLDAREFGMAFASVAGALPPTAIVINRALGLGIGHDAEEATVRDVVELYRNAGVERYFVQRHPDASPPAIASWLEDLGLGKARGWQKFTRGDDPAPVVDCALRIEIVGADHGEEFAGIVCDAFDLGDVARPWLALLPGRPDWHIFMSFAGDEPAGTGALFTRDGVGWTDFGATSPDFRRRGSQSAVLAKRIDHAIGLGCRRIYTCTGEDVAGDPQHSFRNILRMGFETAHVRENYAPRA